MYAASNAFHEAVANGNMQKALLIFSDCVFTDEDISVDRGIQFNEYFNAEEDLAIGQALSNEISFSLFNDDRLLNDYAFGDFIATLGVFIEMTTYIQRSPVTVITATDTQRNTWNGNDDYPFLTKNGSPVLTQPSFAVKSLLGYEGKVYAFGNNGQYAVYDDNTGNNITGSNPVNAFMRNKSMKWNGMGMFYSNGSRMLYIYAEGECLRYEFVPLGHFTAERPKAPDVIQINLTCYDFMQKFDVDMPSDAALGITYPITISDLFVKMCQYVGVQYRSNSFINGTARLTKRPDDFDSVTMREVLKWIAEAAGSNARFDRDGYLELAWLRETEQAYTANGYSEFNPYWYETKPVTKLYNRDTQEANDRTLGGGDEGYLIQDNPLLKGVS